MILFLIATWTIPSRCDERGRISHIGSLDELPVGSSSRRLRTFAKKGSRKEKITLRVSLSPNFVHWCTKRCQRQMELYYNTLLNKTKEIGLIHLDLLGFLCDTFSWIYTRISDKLIVHFVRGFELFTHIRMTLCFRHPQHYGWYWRSYFKIILSNILRCKIRLCDWFRTSKTI